MGTVDREPASRFDNRDPCASPPPRFLSSCDAHQLAEKRRTSPVGSQVSKKSHSAVLGCGTGLVGPQWASEPTRCGAKGARTPNPLLANILVISPYLGERRIQGLPRERQRVLAPACAGVRLGSDLEDASRRSQLGLAGAQDRRISEPTMESGRWVDGFRSPGC
jgi:hypothetical protein